MTGDRIWRSLVGDVMMVLEQVVLSQDRVGVAPNTETRQVGQSVGQAGRQVLWKVDGRFVCGFEKGDG